jgi:hypothetical protein
MMFCVTLTPSPGFGTRGQKIDLNIFIIELDTILHAEMLAQFPKRTPETMSNDPANNRVELKVASPIVYSYSNPA